MSFSHTLPERWPECFLLLQVELVPCLSSYIPVESLDTNRWAGRFLLSAILWGALNRTRTASNPGLIIKYQCSIQFSSVAQSCLTLCDPMNRSMAGLPVHHQLLESTQTHVHQVSDAIQPFHTLSSPSPPSLNLSQHQGLFKWVSSSHNVAKVLEFQLQHQSFQWTPRTDLL